MEGRLSRVSCESLLASWLFPIPIGEVVLWRRSRTWASCERLPRRLSIDRSGTGDLIGDRERPSLERAVPALLGFPDQEV